MFEVVQIGKYYPPYYGGIPGYIQLLAEELKKHYRVTVLVANTSWKMTEEKNGQLRVIRVPRLMELRSAAICPTMPRELRKIRPDLVQLHFPDPMAHLAYLLGKSPAKLVLFWHSDIVRQRLLLRAYGPFLRRLLCRADAVIVTSARLRDNSPWLIPVRERCVIIPFGVDIGLFDPTPEIEERCRELRRAYGERILLFIGRLVYYKGLDVLLEAMEGIEARLLVAGVGPWRKRLERRAFELGITGKVTFLGSIPTRQLLACLHACRLLVLPSTEPSETFGIVQLEAMACRKPVVSTNLPTGVPWVNQDGRTGFVVPPRNAAALRHAIQQILDNPALQRQFGEAGRQRVESEFSKDIHFRRILALYEGLLQGSDLGRPR
jgi:glycosyltransferase involved in cell wall biosynthesis